LTNELLELLKNSAPARIVNVSSSAHKAGRINFDDLQHEKKFSRMKAYANTKLALNLFTFEIARRLEGSGVICNAVNPGFVNTRPSYASRFEILIGTLLSPLGVSPEKGAIPSVYAASNLELEGISGKYLNPKCRQVKASKDSYNDELAAKLWEKAEELTGSILKEETVP
ncbi:MAG: SDR family NAD(P)-dependent oxidoreductase, partial [Candidatus Aminicenantes bacterium]|nr:SDR family NAD(P)-dependent oxidoreductase [Candidatus Aminicenantes bacterium]